VLYIILGAGALLYFVAKKTGVAQSVEETVEDEIVAYSDSFTRFDPLFLRFGRQYGVSPAWLKAICMNESSLGEAPTVALGIREPANREGSKSQDGKSWGIMQVTEVTGRDFDPGCAYFRLNNPEYSVEMAAKVVARSLRSFPVVMPAYEEYNIKAYNGGIGRMQWELSGEWEDFTQAKQDAHRNAIANMEVYWKRYLRNKAIVASKQPKML
jgi:hypothetical protein